MQSFIDHDFASLWNDLLWPLLSVGDAAALAQVSTGVRDGVCDLITALNRTALTALLRNLRKRDINNALHDAMYQNILKVWQEARYLVYTHPPTMHCINHDARSIISPTECTLPDRCDGTVVFHTLESPGVVYERDYEHAFRGPFFPIIDSAMRVCCARLAYECAQTSYRATKRRRLE